MNPPFLRILLYYYIRLLIYSTYVTDEAICSCTMRGSEHETFPYLIIIMVVKKIYHQNNIIRSECSATDVGCRWHSSRLCSPQPGTSGVVLLF